MKQTSFAERTSPKAASTSAGSSGIAITPPAYGIDVVDRESAEVTPEYGHNYMPLVFGVRPASGATIQKHTAAPGAEGGAGTIRPANKTGMPDKLKAGIENLSGMAMDDVRVHYNSAKPAQLQALAYTQGTDIHIAPGQERHLPHEAWHVIQQKQGRVRPTMQAKGAAINDDQALEKEADEMGRKTSYFASRTVQLRKSFYPVSEAGTILQRKTRKQGLSTLKAGAKAVQKPEIENVALFFSKVFSYWLSKPKFVQWLQNRYQLPGSPGAISARPMEIYKNIGKRKSIETTAKTGKKALGAIAALPTFFELTKAAQAMGGGEFGEAQKIFAKAAMVPGIEKLLNEIIDWALFDQAADWQNVASGRDSLIQVVTAGLPDTINLISALIYSFSDAPIPEESRFRMDPSVLDDLYKYIPEEVGMIYYKLSSFFD